MGLTRGLVPLIVLCVIAVAATSSVASASSLEVFAGQDKVSRVNVEVIFNDAKLVQPDPPDPTVSYFFSWDFDNGRDLNLDSFFDNDNETTTMLTSHIYTHPGTYVVTFWVWDSTGAHAKDTCAVTILENLPPEIQVTETQTAYLHVPCTFQAAATDDYSPEHMLRWEWDFGDGEKSNDPPPVTHTYDMLRAYQVRVRVYDPEQEWSEKTIAVNVVEKPGESGTVYTVEGGYLTQSGKKVREDGFIVYSLEAREGHNVSVDVTTPQSCSPVAVFVFLSELALLDYELDIPATWDRDLSEPDMVHRYTLEWTANENGTVYIVLDNGYMGNDPFGQYSGVAVVDITIEELAPLIDETPPTVVLEGPAEGSEVKGVVELSGTAADDRAVSVIELRVDDGDWVEVGNGTDWSYELDTAGLSEGTHTVEVRAFDGNQYSTVDGLEFRVVGDAVETAPTNWMPMALSLAIGAVVTIACGIAYRRRRK